MCTAATLQFLMIYRNVSQDCGLVKSKEMVLTLKERLFLSQSIGKIMKPAALIVADEMPQPEHSSIKRGLSEEPSLKDSTLIGLHVSSTVTSIDESMPSGEAMFGSMSQLPARRFPPPLRQDADGGSLYCHSCFFYRTQMKALVASLFVHLAVAPFPIVGET